MARARFQDYPIFIPANSQIFFSLAGTTVHAYEIDGLLSIEFDSEGQTTAFAKGLQYPEESFNGFSLINKTGADIMGTIIVGTGNLKDGRLSIAGDLTVINSAGDVLEVQEKRADTLNNPVIEPIIDGAAAREILATNADRIHGFVRNLSNVYTVYVGTATAQLIPLAPNEVVDLSGTTYALYAVNNDGVDVDLLVVESE